MEESISISKMKIRWKALLVLHALVARVECDNFDELLSSVKNLHDKVDKIGLEQIKTNEKVDQLQSDLNNLSLEANSNQANDCNEKFEIISSIIAAVNNEVLKIGLQFEDLQETNIKNLNQSQNVMNSLSLEIISKLESCFTENSFSKLPTIECPDETWSKYKDRNCYHLLIDRNDIYECRKECVQLGGDLASIHNKEENEFVASLIRERPGRGNYGRKNAWIGGKYSDRQDSFIWFDQSDWDFHTWTSGQPSMDGCVFMGYDPENPEKWTDGVCSWGSIYSSSTFDCICKI